MDAIPEVPVDERLRWFVGSLNRIVATAHDTGGAFGLMEQWASRGFSPPLHVHHREASALILLDGDIEVRRGDEKVTASAGDCVMLPRDVPHSFVVTSASARFLELVVPGGFEQFHVDASDPAPAAELPPPSAPDVPRLVAASAAYDADILGPPLSL